MSSPSFHFNNTLINMVGVKVRRDGIPTTNENSIPGAYKEVVEAPLTITASSMI
ncbi:hypothetical protein IOC57_05715 [Bacillus sp. SD075]|uniref:hypothetical protein n=1 Tax=Bacillus sp. SD075 TaxID=2781732 RepID=UPI001A96D0E0|nr:hypothetical protein [Bacillus sp. SD075]MBO0997262.1 hypothetical protein [Bacillus sp. SD075]